MISPPDITDEKKKKKEFVTRWSKVLNKNKMHKFRRKGEKEETDVIESKSIFLYPQMFITNVYRNVSGYILRAGGLTTFFF